MTAFVEEQHGSAMWALVMAVPAAAMLAFARSVPLAGIRLTLIVSAIILRGRNNGVERLSLFVQHCAAPAWSYFWREVKDRSGSWAAIFWRLRKRGRANLGHPW